MDDNECHNAIRDLALKRIDQAISKAAHLMMSGAVPAGLSDLIVDENQLAPDVILADPDLYNSMRDALLGWEFPWWKPEMADRLPLLTDLLRKNGRLRYL